MKPPPLNPQRPRPENSLQPPDPVTRRAAVVEVLYWIDMRNHVEGGIASGYPPNGIEVLCPEPPTRAGDVVAGWLTEDFEDSYWAGRGNVIVCGLAVDADKAGLQATEWGAE